MPHRGSDLALTRFEVKIAAQVLCSNCKDDPKVYELVTLATPLCGQRSIEEKVT